MSILKSSTRSLVIGGIFFVLPILIIVILGGKIIKLALPIGHWLSNTLGLHSVFGKASVLIACLLVILIICLISGYLIQKGLMHKWNNRVEEKLFIHFPSLQMFKYRFLAEEDNSMYDFWQAILLKDENSYIIAFITETTEEFLTLYIPDAPRLDAGEVRYVPKKSIEYHSITMKKAMGSLYAFGKGMNIEKKLKKS